MMAASRWGGVGDRSPKVDGVCCRTTVAMPYCQCGWVDDSLTSMGFYLLVGGCGGERGNESLNNDPKRVYATESVWILLG